MYVCLLQMMWTVSDKSTEVCERIIQADFHADMLKDLSWETLSVASLNDPESKVKRDVVETLINILHNVVRRAETARGAFRKYQAVDVVHKFREVKEYPVISYSLFHVNLHLLINS